MKKILILLVMLGVFSILALNVVISDTNQGANVTVTPDFSLSPTPNPMKFGELNPGASNTSQTTLTPGTSNLSVTVNVTDIFPAESTLFDENLKIDKGDGFVDPETVTLSINASTPVSVNYKLNVPIGLLSGKYDATITYTVMEAPKT